MWPMNLPLQLLLQYPNSCISVHPERVLTFSLYRKGYSRQSSGASAVTETHLPRVEQIEQTCLLSLTHQLRLSNLFFLLFSSYLPCWHVIAQEWSSWQYETSIAQRGVENCSVSFGVLIGGIFDCIPFGKTFSLRSWLRVRAWRRETGVVVEGEGKMWFASVILSRLEGDWSNGIRWLGRWKLSFRTVPFVIKINKLYIRNPALTIWHASKRRDIPRCCRKRRQENGRNLDS